MFKVSTRSASKSVNEVSINSLTDEVEEVEAPQKKTRKKRTTKKVEG